MSKKYEDVTQETLDKEFENEDPDVAASIKERTSVANGGLIEDDGFITVYPEIQKTEDKDDDST